MYMKLTKEEVYFIVENHRIGLLANMPKELIKRMWDYLQDQEKKTDKHRVKARKRYHIKKRERASA